MPDPGGPIPLPPDPAGVGGASPGNRLSSLVDRLTPLAGAATGEVIKAEDWNAVVGVLVEVTRAVIAEVPAPTVAPHEHTDQVQVGWLDANLRNLVDRGPLADPAAEARIGALERQVALLASRIERLNGGVDDVRQRVSSVAVNDVVRANDVANVQRTVNGLGDARVDVRNLRSSLADLQAGVATAVSVGQRLTVNGAPIDFEVLDGRLSAVEALKDQLTLPTGQLFDPSVLAQQVTAVQASAVTSDELDAAVAAHPATLSPDQLTEIRAGARDDAVAAVTPSIAAATDALQSQVSAQLAGVNASVSKAVADSQAATIGAALAAIRPEIASAVVSATTALNASLTQQVTASASSLSAQLGGRIDAVTANLPATISTEVGRQVGTRLDSVNAALTSISGRLDATEVRLNGHDALVSQIQGTVAQNARDDATARDALNASFKTQLDQRDQAQRAAIDTRFAQADATDAQRVSQAVADTQRTLSSQIQTVATQAAATQVQASIAGLQSQVSQLAANQVELHKVVGTTSAGTSTHIGDVIRGLPNQ
jgi:hypothetical protein